MIDCPPSLGLLTLNAFAASDYLLIPLQCEYYALEGISMSHKVLNQVRSSGINPRLELLGVVMTMFDARTRLSAQVVDEVRAAFRRIGVRNGHPARDAAGRGPQLWQAHHSLRQIQPRRGRLRGIDRRGAQENRFQIMKTIVGNLTQILAVLALSAVAAAAKDDSTKARWWSDAAEQSLNQGGTNRQELVRALGQVPTEERPAMQFLVENMPESDLQTLAAGYLLENTELATAAFVHVPWHDQIPSEIFLNDILPYCCANETRDDWRQKLHDLSAPLIEGCTSPGQAAQNINAKLFPLVNVHYSTKRKRADQSALETMGSGLASCTGLSILLIDACRSVGIPARLAGTPMWVNMRGNHTWVEVWDGGWHFIGAAEPDPKGLDHAWFEHDASQALKDSPTHAIYASSFEKTGLAFPLDWAPESTG